MIVVHSTNNDVVCEILVVSETVEERERGVKAVQSMRAAIVGGSGLGSRQSDIHTLESPQRPPPPPTRPRASRQNYPKGIETNPT